jgi:hypothetical protein
MGNSKNPKKSYKERYPVIYMEGNIAVRSMNLISIYLPQIAMAKVARISNDHGISLGKILALSSKPCECCKGQIITINHNGVDINIPKGLLYSPKQQSGIPLSKRKK